MCQQLIRQCIKVFVPFIEGGFRGQSKGCGDRLAPGWFAVGNLAQAATELGHLAQNIPHG
jgi:hypothetical protein